MVCFLEKWTVQPPGRWLGCGTAEGVIDPAVSEGLYAGRRDADALAARGHFSFA
jgi:hypothetical protein